MVLSCRTAWRRLLLTLVVVALTAAPALAEPRGAASEQDLPLIKAAMVFNICKFVTWPADRPVGDTFVVGLLDAARDDPAFDSVVGKELHQREVHVVTVTGAADLAACDVLYVGDLGPAWGELRSLVADRNILTVSDQPGFASRGGVVELEQDDGRLRFNINKAVAELSGLQPSSQLLKIAKEVLGSS